MISNVYLAFGIVGETQVMKIGKANVMSRREKQIKLSIEMSIECENESSAFAVESRFRSLARELGAQEHLEQLDREIASYTLRYWHIILAEPERLRQELQKERDEKQALQEECWRLIREIGRLEGRIEEMEKATKNAK